MRCECGGPRRIVASRGTALHGRQTCLSVLSRASLTSPRLTSLTAQHAHDFTVQRLAGSYFPALRLHMRRPRRFESMQGQGLVRLSGVEWSGVERRGKDSHTASRRVAPSFARFPSLPHQASLTSRQGK